MSFVNVNQTYTQTIDVDNQLLISYKFDVPTAEFSTSGTFATVLYANQNVIIQGNDKIKNVIEYLSIDDTLTADIEFFDITKEFRYALSGTNFSAWIPFNLTNIKTIGANLLVDIQFRYSSINTLQNYNIHVNIKKPDISTWFQVWDKDLNQPFTFSKDFPQKGELKWFVGYGTSGQYHIDSSTSKLYVKSNGFWTGGVKFQRNSTTSGIVYIPTIFNGHTLSDSFINNISSTIGLVPINDYQLGIDLKYGIDFQTAVNTSSGRPNSGDYLFFNPAFQGIGLQGIEEIRSVYTFSTLPIGYTPRVYIKEIDLLTNQFIPTSSTEPIFCLANVGDQIIFKPAFTLKMFSMDFLVVEVDGMCSTSWNPCLDIKFRYSFNSRYWDTQFMPLTLSNLKCIKPNPLKFFYIEFLFTKICNNNGNPICISDLIINGNIQNINNNYQTLNRFGLRTDCNYGDTTNSSSGGCPTTNCNNQNIPTQWITDLTGCGNNLGTFNPYNVPQSVALLEKLSNDVSNIFGYNVDYYKTEANDAGVDNVLHEYGTYDTVVKKSVKVLVPDNKFPEDIINISMLDMSLFDNFEIHITRQEFYNKFGIGVRPANGDFLFFCQINKWFKIEHSQSYRSFNNASIYYRVSLTKKQDDKNIDNRTYSDEFNSMIENNQIDNLLGKEVKEDIKKVVDNPLQENLTELNAVDFKLKYDDNVEIVAEKGVDKNDILDLKKPDPYLLNVLVPITDKELENGTTVIARAYYDLTTKVNDNAIIYQTIDNNICDCCNRAFSAWFNIYQYQAGMVYNLINNYNSVENKGYKIDFIDGKLEVVWDTQIFDIDVHLSPSIFYGIVVNFNQKQHKLEVYIYKRKGNCSTDELELVDEAMFDLQAVNITGDLTMKIRGSYLYLTNIRIWSEIIPKSKIVNVLNQYIVKNVEYLILADNVDKVVKSNHKKY